MVAMSSLELAGDSVAMPEADGGTSRDARSTGQFAGMTSRHLRIRLTIIEHPLWTVRDCLSNVLCQVGIDDHTAPGMLSNKTKGVKTAEA